MSSDFESAYSTRPNWEAVARHQRACARLLSGPRPVSPTKQHKLCSSPTPPRWKAAVDDIVIKKYKTLSAAKRDIRGNPHPRLCLISPGGIRFHPLVLESIP